MLHKKIVLIFSIKYQCNIFAWIKSSYFMLENVAINILACAINTLLYISHIFFLILHLLT